MSKTIEQLKDEFIAKQQAAIEAALQYHNAVMADPDADPLAVHQGLGQGIVQYNPAGPLLTADQVKVMSDHAINSIKATDWLKVAEKVIGTVLKFV